MAMIGYDEFEKRVVLSGRVRLKAGLHIGSGRGTGVGGSDLPVLKDFQSRPFIPGSSFKGVLRSNVEAFLRAFKKDVKLVCDVIQDKGRCVDKDLKRQIVGGEGQFKGKDPDEELWQQSCWVCQLFGSPWIASKVNVVDMPVASFFPSEWIMVRDGVVIDRETETAAAHLKYDFETVPAGTTFSMEILVENPRDYEMGLLVLGLDFFNQGLALLGGNTSRGLGRLEIDIDDLREETKETILSRLKPPSQEMVQPEISQSSTDTRSSVSPSPEIDEATQAVQECLATGEIFDENRLVQAMQQRGWTKDRVQSTGYRNYRDLFQKAARRKVIIDLGDNRYQVLQVESGLTEEEVPKEDSAVKAKREEIERKKSQWREALWKKLKKITGEEG